MPRGKELEQLPMANTLPGMGDDQSKMNRTNLNGILREDTPRPGEMNKQKQQK
ncbi:hypothetical protein SM124_15105 [Bacillus sp. 31A1R]|uniref:Uncharacterized protein n=1 Tax=Robertmurraya mangrovi TaxID=3098077 RepID=A0ABU5J0U9_9BACI|nr:hypothetical protein [Bacillus sp. 31A1R]MDZ5473045.1 hypothetical protein [Bacillus sp. 31A1R]